MKLKKFVEEMPLPQMLTPDDSDDGTPVFSLTVEETTHQFHPDLPETKVWAYNGILPSPALEVGSGEKVKINWNNILPREHFLPVDPTLHRAGELPGARTAPYVHGALGADPEDTGDPEAWFVNQNQYIESGPRFKDTETVLPNDQPAATLWYHDQAMGVSRLNRYAGLAGFYLIHDGNERDLDIPVGLHDLPIMLQDRCFNEDGDLLYPKGNGVHDRLEVSQVGEVFGDVITANGKAFPYKKVEPNPYRVRLVNASNGRYYSLGFGDVDVKLIATDGGFVEKPLTISEPLLLAPGERAELILDFTGKKGETFTVTNEASAPFPGGGTDEAVTEIMEFRVENTPTMDNQPELPEQLAEVERLDPDHAYQTRDILLTEDDDVYGRPVHQFDYKTWGDEPAEDPFVDYVEVWRFINTTSKSHPVHLHGIRFQVVDREDFDLEGYRAHRSLNYSGDRSDPAPHESGWKDTVNVNPGEAVRIIANFGPDAGSFVYHSMIAEHEDYDMIRPFEIKQKR